MRILLTGAGGPSAISVWKSLGQSHQIFMADMDPQASGLYLVPAGQRRILPRGDAPDFVEHTLEVCRACAIDVLICTVDAELAPLARARARFEAMGVRLPLSPLPALLLCRDKLALLEHVKDVVPVPAFERLDAASLGRTRNFPLFAKPRVSAGGRGAAVVGSEKELEYLPADGSFILQELLPGDEYSVDVYLGADGTAVAAVPRLRMKIDSGIAVAARTVQYPALSTLAVQVAQAAGVRFVANVQFRCATNGQPRLLEINARFPGTLPLTAESGVDIPALMLAELEGKSLPKELLPFKECMVVRYWSEQFIDPDEWRALCNR